MALDRFFSSLMVSDSSKDIKKDYLELFNSTLIKTPVLVNCVRVFANALLGSFDLLKHLS